jgi:hypothetical protein
MTSFNIADRFNVVYVIVWWPVPNEAKTQLRTAKTRGKNWPPN